MKTVGLFLNVILAAAVCTGASGMTADELIAKHLENSGGLERFKAVQSVRATGKVLTAAGGGACCESGGAVSMELPFVALIKRPNLVRFDLNAQGLAVIQAYDGERGWGVNPLSGGCAPQTMSALQEKAFKYEADLDGPLVDYRKKGYRVEFVGKTDVEGTEVYLLKLDTDDDIAFDMYLDTEHYLLIKQTSRYRLDDSEHKVDIYLSDYKEVDGMLLPFAREIRVGGQTITQFMYDRFEINVPIDDAVFQKPAETETAALEDS